MVLVLLAGSTTPWEELADPGDVSYRQEDHEDDSGVGYLLNLQTNPMKSVTFYPLCADEEPGK